MTRPLFLSLTAKEGYGSRSISVKLDRILMMETTRDGYTAIWLDGEKNPVYVCESQAAINQQAQGKSQSGEPQQ